MNYEGLSDNQCQQVKDATNHVDDNAQIVSCGIFRYNPDSHALELYVDIKTYGGILGAQTHHGEMLFSAGVKLEDPLHHDMLTQLRSSFKMWIDDFLQDPTGEAFNQ